MSRDPFPLEGPEYKAFVLSSGSHSSLRQRTKCPPPLLPTYAPVLSQAPRRSVPLEQLKSQEPKP